MAANWTTKKHHTSCTTSGPQPTGAQGAATVGIGEHSEDRVGTLSKLIGSWIGGEGAAEQRDTMVHLIRTLDDNRLSDRKLFPRELKGKSW